MSDVIGPSTLVEFNHDESTIAEQVGPDGHKTLHMITYTSSKFVNLDRDLLFGTDQPSSSLLDHMPLVSLEASVTTELYTGIMLNASIKSKHGPNN